MRRIFVEPQYLSQNQVQFVDESFHHVTRVLRMQPNDELGVLCGDGFLYSCRLQDVGKKAATAVIIEKKELPKALPPSICMAVSLPRLNTFEWILEKAVELGVEAVQPLISEHSFIKKEAELTPSKLERLHKIIRSATEQTCRGDLMELKPTLTLADWLQQERPKACVFAYEGEGVSLKKVLKSYRAEAFAPIWTLTGSEGGFSLKEVQLLQSFNLSAVSMGHQILRAETACLALVSVIKYEFDHMGDI